MYRLRFRSRSENSRKSTSKKWMIFTTKSTTNKSVIGTNSSSSPKSETTTVINPPSLKSS